LQTFYQPFTEALALGHFPGKKGVMVSITAVRRKAVVGVIVVHTMNLADAKAGGQLPYDIVENQGPETEAAYIMVLAVDRACRREGIGSELVYKAVSRAVTADTVAAVSATRALGCAGAVMMCAVPLLPFCM
jgi:ribosomal protein S18 acetylase RimI-like enzyme